VPDERGERYTESRYSTNEEIFTVATLNELLAQREALEKQIADTRRNEHAEALAQIRALMDQHGITLADLSGKAGQGAARTRRAPKAGGKVAAKYRNSATGDTWSGRGLQPRWLKAALATGRKLEDFAV
jgi:DNA-binding protein H-NS